MHVDRSGRARWLDRRAGALLAWAILAVVVLLETWPPPDTTRGWALLLLVGPPAYLVLEWVGSRLFSPEVSARISPARFSWARIAYGTVVATLVLAPLIWWQLTHAS